MKHKKLFILLGAVTIAPIAAIAAVSCGNGSTSTSETKGKLDVDKNREFSLGNVQGTASQVENLYKGISAALNTVLTVTMKDDTTSSEKTALTTFQTAVNTEMGKLYAKTEAKEAGAVRAKIAALKVTDDDYKTKLEAVDKDLKDMVTNFKTSFTTLLKALNSTLTDSDVETSYNNLLELKDLYGTYSQFKPETDHYLDLARFFESQATSLGSTLAGEFKGSTLKDKATLFAKRVGQMLNLATKRELQTVAMARVVIATNSDTKLLAAVKTLSELQSTRLEKAKLPFGFRSLVTTSLSLKLKLMQKKVEAVSTASKVAGVNAEAKTLVDAMLTELTLLQSSYDGFSTEVTPGFKKSGLNKATTSLNTLLKAVPSETIDTVEKFNTFFQTSAQTWQDPVGNVLNSFGSKSALAKVVAALTSDDANSLKTKLSSATDKVDTDLWAALQELSAYLKDVALESDYNTLTSTKPEADRDLESSAVIVNQYVRGVSSLGQLYLLQAAVDVLGLNATDYAVGKVA